MKGRNASAKEKMESAVEVKNKESLKKWQAQQEGSLIA